MNIMKKKLTVVIALVLALAVLAACGSPGTAGETASQTAPETTAVTDTAAASDSAAPEATDPPSFDENNPLSVATLAGPTGMGMIELFDNPAYEVGLYTSPDQITTKVISGEVSVAAVPSNIAAVLYNRMGGGIKIAAVTTMGVLYIVENGDTVNSIADLAGKTIYATGQGSTPEYVLGRILEANGLTDVNVVYMGAHADLANAMAAGEVTLALLPEPFVSTVTAANPDISVKIDINEEWQKIYGAGAGMPMGVTIVSNALAADEAGMARLIADSGASVNYVTTNSEAAAADIVAQQIVGSEAIALSAIPRCGISFITGDACKAILDDYFAVMFASNPDSLGGAIPDDDIYYMP
jgi:ABC-type nitrate/sulfonate/bicarbonate transport systems, periplasmic components